MILWLTILEFARKTNNEVVYITNDSGYWDETADQPVQQIQEDLKAKKTSIKLFRRIETFLATHSLKRTEVEPTWATQVFVATKLGDLLAERVASQQLVGELISHTVVHQQLEGGSVFDIGPSAKFAELIFQVTLKMRLQTYIFRSSASSQSYASSDLGFVGQIPQFAMTWGQNDPSILNPTKWSWELPSYSEIKFENRPLNEIPPSVILGGKHMMPAQMGGIFQPQFAEPVIQDVSVTIRAKFSVRLLEKQPPEVSLDSYDIVNTGSNSINNVEDASKS